MTRKQGRIAAALALALLVAAAVPGCGRSATQAEREDGAGGVGQGGELPDGNVVVGGEVGVAGKFAGGGEGQSPVGGEPAIGGESGVAGEVGTGGGGAIGGDSGTMGGAGPEPCVPGARECDGSSIRVCDASGHSTLEKTCSASQVCRQAQCKDIVCVPNRQFCKANVVRTCSSSGTDSSAQQVCAAEQFCVEQDGSAACSDFACLPNAPSCFNNVATTCKADGSGPQPGGQDCSPQSMRCDNGACYAPTCQAGQKLCENGDLYLCTGDGLSKVLFADCAAGEICDANQLACRPSVCEAGKLGCDGSRVVTCNELGTGWLQSGPDCGATERICLEGSCKKQVCVPSSTFCQEGNLYSCDSHGLTSSLKETCNAYSYHCSPHPYQANTAYCAYNTCTPNAAVCNGNVLAKCNADGSGLLPGGADCGADSLCQDGTCKPKTCSPGSYFCKNDDIIYCSDGVYSFKAQDCPDDAPCASVSGGGVGCVPYKCWPGTKACIGNQLGVCAADGQSLGSVKQDCSATDDVCVSEAACEPTAVDSVGSAEELASVSEGYVFGNVIEVRSNRRLTLLEANLVLPGPRTLRWVVYEQVDGYFTSRYDALTNAQAGSGFLGSGALNYTLKAGKTYLLGVAVTGGGLAPYYDAQPWQPEVSFGAVTGGVTSSYSVSFYAYANASSAFNLRATTQLP